ncbi:hypothetical protein PLANPX_2990 [Lacipirellula parvula]|uniref:Uncharacterized protein n=1 Tax=Lacipirellula parvula TaxID=2650471 RepID=A0A5K7XA02_9BACT|nr:hypothetical protein PLANPX_2990 [Lacipirellula parvula]
MIWPQIDLVAHGEMEPEEPATLLTAAPSPATSAIAGHCR